MVLLGWIAKLLQESKGVGGVVKSHCPKSDTGVTGSFSEAATPILCLHAC